jgi:hypothetical protein
LEKENDKLLENVEKMREREERRHTRALERISGKDE